MLDKMSDSVAAAFHVEKRPHRNQLTTEQMMKLQEVCSAAFRSDVNLDVLQLITDYCLFVDRTMRGRAAGNAEDFVVRYLMRYFSSLNEGRYSNPCHVEIGVLFGAATIFASHAVGLAGKQIPIVAIDPFEGYYQQKEDPVTNVPVTQDIVLENLKLFGLKPEDVELIKAYSTDPSTLEKIKGRQILSLLIDGDHSYNGVKADWLNYSPLVAPGGYVLIDDYNYQSSWPGVSECLNKEILPNMWGKWDIALIYGGSLLLRRTDIPEDFDLVAARDAFREITTCQKRVRELEEVEKKYRFLKEEHSRVEKQLAQMHHSLSWRLTYPLRKLKRIWSE